MCSGIYRIKSEQFSKVCLPVVSKYVSTIRQLVWDLDNVSIVPVVKRYEHDQISTLANWHKKFGYTILNLGIYSSRFFQSKELKLDEIFYRDADIDLSQRWERYNNPPKSEREKEVVSRLVRTRTPYIFLHEDKSRGFLIKRDLINPDLPVIEPSLDSKAFSIFDYRMLIEGASEVHVIESSFGFLIDSMRDLRQKLFLHRYSRPEPNLNPQMNVNYRRNWVVFTKV